MLANIRKGLGLAAAISLLSAASAQAETHEVLILDGGYFPQKLYMNDGDHIAFVNETIGIHRIEGLDFQYEDGEGLLHRIIQALSENGNDLSRIIVAPGRTVVISLEDESPLVYSGIWPDSVENDLEEVPTGLIEGVVSYDDPPLEEDSEQLDIEYIN